MLESVVMVDDIWLEWGFVRMMVLSIVAGFGDNSGDGWIICGEGLFGWVNIILRIVAEEL